MQVVTLRVPIRNVIQEIPSIRGGKTGKCIECGEVGIFHPFGYPNRVGKRLAITHAPGCSMNKYLANDGSLKKRWRS